MPRRRRSGGGANGKVGEEAGDDVGERVDGFAHEPDGAGEERGDEFDRGGTHVVANADRAGALFHLGELGFRGVGHGLSIGYLTGGFGSR